MRILNICFCFIEKYFCASHHDLDVSEASIVRPELRLELIELRPLGGHAQLVVLEDEGGPAT